VPWCFGGSKQEDKMKSLTKLIIKLLVLLLIVLWITVDLTAKADVIVNFRFYRGVKGKSETKSSVVTSYQLKPLFVGNIVTGKGPEQEKEELKRIFNLKDIMLMANKQVGWQEIEKGKTQMFAMGLGMSKKSQGTIYYLNLGVEKKKDTFRVEVIEKEKDREKELLGTEIILPEMKTTIFGFEGSAEWGPYFLSIRREQDASVVRDEPALTTPTERPVLILHVPPIYPPVALRAQIEGDVILRAVTDTKGNVKDVTPISGNPLLRKAAIKAVKKWKYEAYMVKGKAVPAMFTVTVTFRLDQTGRKQDNVHKKKVYVGNPIDVKFKDASLQDVLNLFRKMSGVDITVDPGLTALVTCDFTNVPWEEALQLILKLNGMEMIPVIPHGKKLLVKKAKPGVHKHNRQQSETYTGEPYDFLFKNMEMSKLFEFIGKISGSEVSVDPGIDGALSCNMKQAPWDEALELMLRVNDLYMTKENNHIRIRKIVRSEDKKTASVPDIWPTAGYLSDSFGERIHPITGKKNFHTGIDIATRHGNPVKAPADGVVIRTAFRKSSGNIIILDHQNGYTTQYHKLSAFKVKEGDKVKKGDVIGFVGNSGQSTGPHLHWEVHLNGKPINPMNVIKN
jgi:TonB family protein